jgi:hypothetical protein
MGLPDLPTIGITGIIRHRPSRRQLETDEHDEDAGKHAHQGAYLARVDVMLLVTDDAWSPYLSLEDAYRLDDVRAALRTGEIKAAAQMARVFKLVPVAS